MATGAGYGGEFAVLYVEYFAPEAAGGADLAGLAVFVMAFGAFEVEIGHEKLLKALW